MDVDGLRLNVLGALTGTYNDAALDLGGRRQRAVLAVLLIARGEVVPAERLADSVWGEDAPGSTTAALQSYVSHLRRRLEPGASARARGGVIASSGGGYSVLLPPDALDAWRFEALLKQAEGATADVAVPTLGEGLSLWRGPAYAEYEFEPWAEAEIARLSELRNVARERLAEARLALGESSLLVPELEAMVAEQPLREERWRLLALALYRAQRQADALNALQRARTTLADELGVDPGPALRALQTEVLAQSPSLDVPAQRTAVAQPSRAESGGGAAAGPPRDLVGREREMAVLNRSVQDVCGGKSSLLLIEGPAGIGKTRLLNEATRLASESRLTVLSARGSLLERSFGFGAARQLFEPLLLDAVRREALIAGSASSSRGVFEQIERDQRADGSFSVLHGLYWLTVNLTAEGPVVLAVDDVQWCDTGSLRFLAYLVKRLEGLPLLVVATLRTGEHHEDDELLAELALDPATISVRPGPLTDDATGLMVRDRLGEAAAPVFIAACHRTTGGNPLLLRQLLRALEVEGVKPDVAHTDTVRAVGSRAISSMVLMRLRRMPEVVTATARAVAVLGDSADLPQVAELAAVPEDDCAAALATLSRAEILRDEQRLAFVHPLVRDAVYRDVPAAERALAHERAARVLQSHGASPEQVAAHLLLAPRRGDAATVAVLRAAARIAADRGASDTAVVLLRRALEEPALGRERVDVLLELGVLETLVDGPAAAEHLSEAYAFVDDPATRGETAIVIARTHVFASPPGVATAFARDAALALPADSVDVRQGLVALERITGFMHGLEPATYRRDPPPEITGNEPGALMLAATLGFETLLAGEDRERAVRLARFALADDRLWTVDTGLLWIVAAMTRMLADDDIGDFWDRARAHAHRTGAVFGALSANMWGGYAEWRRGELREALQSLADAAEQDRMWGGRVAPDYLDAITMGVYLDRGDLVAARRVADGALSREFVGEGRRLVLEMVARLLIEEKRPADALAALEDATDPVGIVNPAWAPWRGIRARALHELGRSAEARELIEEEVQLLRRWGAASSLGPSLRLLGEIAGAEGTPQLREAVQVLASTRASVELARARVSLAKAADVPDSEAVLLLEQAVESARSTCAEGVLQEALAALQRRGRQIDVRTETAAGLTRTERRVLDLTKAGLDEREIAQRLLLTPGRVRATLELVSSRSGV